MLLKFIDIVKIGGLHEKILKLIQVCKKQLTSSSSIGGLGARDGATDP